MSTIQEPCPPLPGHLEVVAKILASHGFHHAAACVRSADKALTLLPAPTDGRAGKEELAKVIRESLVDDVRDVANPERGVRHPDILEEGCRAIGYVDPEDAAEKTAVMVAEAVLKHLGLPNA